MTRLLYWMILPQLFCIIGYTVLTMLTDSPNLERHLLVGSSLTFGDLAALFLALRGLPRASAAVNAIVVFIIATGSMILVDGTGVGAIGGYLYLVLSVGVSLGNFRSFLAALVSLVAGLAALVLQSRGIIPLRHASITPLEDWAIFASFVAIFFVIQLVARSSLNEALRRANGELELRTRAEKELRQSEQHFRFLAEATFEGLFIVEEGKILFANEQMAKIVGYSREELVGRDTLSLVPAEMKDHLLRIRKQPEVVDTLTALRKDGTRFEAEIRRRPMVYFGRTVQSVAVRDMSESQKLKAAKKESEIRYRDLVEHVRDAIFSIAPNGELNSLNPAFRSITGFRESDWLGRDFRELVHPQDVLLAVELFSRVVQGVAGETMELRIRTSREEFATVEVIVSPQLRDGKIIGALGVARDVTERKALAGQVRRMQRLDTIGALAGGMAHDLNNILVPILPAMELVRAAGVDPSTENILAIVDQSVYRAREIVQQVLTFAHGRDDDQRPIQLRYLVDEVCSIIHSTFPPDLRIEVRVPRDLKLVVGNATQLHQVLMNLCVNARDAMPDGGCLSIAAANIVEGNGSSETVELSVSDTGTGIPEGIREEIFKPLFTTKEAGKGTGLGLSTVANIIREHRGTIDFENGREGGTCFRIRLPVAESVSENGGTPAAAGTVPAGRGEHIVIVDHDRSIGEICRQTLEAYGYDPVVFASGAKALEHASERGLGGCAVLVLDFRLPFVTAVHTIREMRSVDADVRIVALIDQGTEPHQFLSWWESAVGGGPVGCLKKPFTAADLAAEIGTILQF